MVQGIHYFFKSNALCLDITISTISKNLIFYLNIPKKIMLTEFYMKARNLYFFKRL
jgi:hypothetical protein